MVKANFKPIHLLNTSLLSFIFCFYNIYYFHFLFYFNYNVLSGYKLKDKVGYSHLMELVASAVNWHGTDHTFFPMDFAIQVCRIVKKQLYGHGTVTKMTSEEPRQTCDGVATRPGGFASRWLAAGMSASCSATLKGWAA